jgi:hypothetical protein
MTDYNPNRPTGSSVPPERDRVGGTPPPEYRGGPPRGDGGNSAMALIVGALAVALIIGAFFWFAGDTQDTATLDDPAVVEEDMGTTDEPATGTDEETTLGTDQDVTITEEETNTTMTQEPAEDTEVIDETQQDATSETGDAEVIDETQQN